MDDRRGPERPDPAANGGDARMSDGWGSVRVVAGVLTVDDDAIRLRSTPRLFLAGQVDRLRTDEPRHRLRALGTIVAFLVAPLLLVGGLYRLTTAGVGWLAFVEIVSLGTGAATIWHQHLRETVVPLDSVREVIIGQDDRRLELVHAPRDGLLSRFRTDPRRRGHRFRTAEDGRRARELFRLRGIDVVDGDARSEVTYRIETRGGVCFCEQCGGQVSPSDSACPACEYKLRVRQADSA